MWQSMWPAPTHRLCPPVSLYLCWPLCWHTLPTDMAKPGSSLCRTHLEYHLLRPLPLAPAKAPVRPTPGSFRITWVSSFLAEAPGLPMLLCLPPHPARSAQEGQDACVRVTTDPHG